MATSMDACLAVEKDIEKVMLKFDKANETFNRELEEVGLFAKGIRSTLAEDENGQINDTHRKFVEEALHKLKDCMSKISSEHKDLHAFVSRVGKAIDRNFTPGFSGYADDQLLTNHSEAVNYVIVEHFLRQGNVDIAESLIEESQIVIDPDVKGPFLEIHRILEALREKDLSHALQWIQDNREKIEMINSPLEFKLHRLHLVHLLTTKPFQQQAVLEYAQNLAPFAYAYQKEVQELMGAIIYVHRGLEHSPYSHLLDPYLWTEVSELFTRDACALVGLSVESSLSVVMSAGCRALPPLLNLQQVIQQKKCTGVWSSSDELPMEIDLGKEHRYHSVFACPILRQQCTENNPPLRLVCGHVISKDALNKLSQTNKVKCPYCPMEQSPSDARQITF